MNTAKLFKTPIVVGVIAAAAAVVYYRGAPQRATQHPLLAELDRLRADTEQLLDKTTRQIGVLDPACAKLHETVAELDARCRELAASVDDSQRALNEHEQVLRQYSTLVEKQEGAVLADGKYIPVDIVYQQYAFEQQRHRILMDSKERQVTCRATFDRFRQTARQRLAKAVNALADLHQAREQLQKQTEQAELLVQTFSAAGLSESSLESDVKRLRREIATVQDLLDIQMVELPDTIAIEQLEPVDTLSLR